MRERCVTAHQFREHMDEWVKIFDVEYERLADTLPCCEAADKAALETDKKMERKAI